MRPGSVAFTCAMFLVLVSLILRPAGFEYGNKFSPRVRSVWDYALFASALDSATRVWCGVWESVSRRAVYAR